MRKKFKNIRLSKAKLLSFFGGKKEYDRYALYVTSDNYYGGQVDMSAWITYDGQVVAVSSLTLFEGVYNFKIIESLVKRKGYGLKLLVLLAQKYGYELLERSSLTEQGYKMRQAADELFDFDFNAYLDSQNKHLAADKVIKSIKNPIIASFLKDLIKLGDVKSWDKWLKNSRFLSLINNKYDANDVVELSEWIKGSVTNFNEPTSEPPYYVLETLKVLARRK